MTPKFYVDKAIRKLKYDSLFALNKFNKLPVVTIKTSDVRFPIHLRKNTSDISTFYQIFYYKGYDFNINFEPKVIFDCGANVGLASVYFKNKYPNVKIVAIEPESSNFEMLQKNTSYYKDITCVKAGIWNKSTNLRVYDSGQGHWGFATIETTDEGPDIVKAISIDELMRQHDVDYIDILKVDIESSEKELFEANFEKWLPKCRIVLVELHDYMKEGCTRSFFKAMVNYRFTMMNKGENVICELLP